jgi:hypothetical protein
MIMKNLWATNFGEGIPLDFRVDPGIRFFLNLIQALRTLQDDHSDFRPMSSAHQMRADLL